MEQQQPSRNESLWKPGMHLQGTLWGKRNAPSNEAVWWCTVFLNNQFCLEKMQIMPHGKDCQSSESEIPLLATWRRRRPAFLRPTCSLDSAKSSRAVTGKKGRGGGGSLFEGFSLRSDAPCAGCGGSRQTALLQRDSAMNGAKRTTSFQSCCRCLRCWTFL